MPCPMEKCHVTCSCTVTGNENYCWLPLDCHHGKQSCTIPNSGWYLYTLGWLFSLSLLERYLTEKVVPGNRVTVMGIYSIKKVAQKNDKVRCSKSKERNTIGSNLLSAHVLCFVTKRLGLEMSWFLYLKLPSDHLVFFSGPWWCGCWNQEAIPPGGWHSGWYRRPWPQLWSTTESSWRGRVQQICKQAWCFWDNSKEYSSIYLWQWRCQEGYCMFAVWRFSQKVWKNFWRRLIGFVWICHYSQIASIWCKGNSVLKRSYWLK